MIDMDTPKDGWWPEEAHAPVTQMLFRDGHQIANIIKTRHGWRSFSLLETSKSGTTGMPLDANGSVQTRAEAKHQAETYADLKKGKK